MKNIMLDCDVKENLEGKKTKQDKTHATASPPPGKGGGGGKQPMGTKVRLTLSNVSNDQPLDLFAIRKQLLWMTKGFPKVAGGLLCYRKKDAQTGRRKPHYLEDTASLVSWLDRYCKVRWFCGVGYYSKEELFKNLLQNCEQYSWATDLFHWPPLPGVLYTEKMPQPSNSGRLDELVAMFDAHSDVDRVLIKAFILTPFWGGPPRKRPLFILSTANAENDPNAGRASGKTTLAQVVGKISGGCFPLQKESDMDRVLTDLLSPKGMGVRMILMDNVKSLKLSSPFIESLITADEIGGHQLYKGHGCRPNFITYVMTANEPMMSTDFATRGISILINQSKKSSAWEAKLEAMLNNPQFMAELHADILWHLQKPGSEFTEDEEDRWAMWWCQVGSRACKDAEELCRVRDEVKRRRIVLDADRSSRELVEEILHSIMTASAIHDPEGAAVFFPTLVLQKMLGDLLGRNCHLTEVGQRLNAMKPRNLFYEKNGPLSCGRGYWWVGDSCDVNAPRGIGFAFVADPSKPNGYFRVELHDCRTKLANVLEKARGQKSSEEQGKAEQPLADPLDSPVPPAIPAGQEGSVDPPSSKG